MATSQIAAFADLDTPYISIDVALNVAFVRMQQMQYAFMNIEFTDWQQFGCYWCNLHTYDARPGYVLILV